MTAKCNFGALGEAIRLAAIGIVNTHDQLTAAVRVGLIKKSQAATFYWQKHERFRVGGWKAYSPFVHLDPKGHWQDRGAKSFESMDRKDNSEALAFVIKLTGISDWSKNSIKDWVPTIVNKQFPLRKTKS